MSAITHARLRQCNMSFQFKFEFKFQVQVHFSFSFSSINIFDVSNILPKQVRLQVNRTHLVPGNGLGGANRSPVGMLEVDHLLHFVVHAQVELPQFVAHVAAWTADADAGARQHDQLALLRTQAHATGLSRVQREWEPLSGRPAHARRTGRCPRPQRRW